jgi:uncharacterized protein YcbK (DUF882 family)
MRKCAAFVAAIGASSAFVTLLTTTETQNAIANGDTRTIYLHHAHTNEDIAATYMVDGYYDSKVLQQLNWFLRDWRLDEPTKMDARLFDVIWQTYRESGSRAPILVLSAYRSPQTNAMLRRRSRAVAEHSQHMAGKAMDMRYADVPMSRIREIGMHLQMGGVGYYPGQQFVHLDVGSVRAWPRMSYDQLARLFPDGKTVHLPSNGHPLPGYELARAEVEARGIGSAPTLAQVQSKGFFAMLFGGGEDEDVIAAQTPRARGRGAAPPVRTAALAPRPAPTPGTEDNAAAFFRADSARATGGQTPVAPQTPVVARAQNDLPQGQTFIGPAPTPSSPAVPPPVVRTAPEIASADVKIASAIDLPMPPRRPGDLASIVASLTPLPPVRPIELAALAPPRPAPAAPPSARKDAIAGLIGTFDPSTSGAGPGGLPKVITEGTALQASAATPGVMAYAPDPSPVGRSVIMKRSSTVTLPVRTTRPPAPAKKTDFVAARLDRSNFQSLTSPTQVSRMETPTTLGSTIAALRPASRVDTQALVFSTAGASPAQFEPYRPLPTTVTFAEAQNVGGLGLRADASAN